MNEPCYRLKAAREAAGFSSARSAAQRHGWKESTYAAHENGQNKLKPDVAIEYAKAFNTTADWLMFGQKPALGSIDSLLADLPDDIAGALSNEFKVMIRAVKVVGRLGQK
jgi:transcriptional regulator with XRE-family HTH domain